MMIVRVRLPFPLLVVAQLLARGTLGIAQGISPDTTHVPHTYIAPAVGLGLWGNGQRVYAGLQVEHQPASHLAAGLFLDAWTIPAVCTPSGTPDSDRERCAGTGWDVLLAFTGYTGTLTSKASLFAGPAFGLAKPGRTHLTAALRLGSRLSLSSRTSTFLELRLAHVFHALDKRTATLFAGLRFQP